MYEDSMWLGRTGHSGLHMVVLKCRCSAARGVETASPPSHCLSGKALKAFARAPVVQLTPATQ